VITAETNDQFFARMLIATREGTQVSNEDAEHLSKIAGNGPGPRATTMPEEHPQSRPGHVTHEFMRPISTRHEA
jgi:hypothetical protein